MKIRHRFACAALLIGAAFVPAAARAELPVARLMNVFPISARQGTSVEIVCKGENLEEPAGLYFSHRGITAELAKSTADKLPRFKVTIAPDVPVGVYDVRTISKFGISNPRAFAVGDQEELLEQEPNNEQETANRVPLNSVVCGRIVPAEDVDWFVFTAKKGQRVLIECWAVRLDSKLDGFLWLFDSHGKQLAVSQDENSRSEKTDPLIDFDAPADGDYFVKFSDFLYNGSDLNVYSLHIGTAPLVDFMQPSGVQPGQTTPVTVFGRNLPGGEPSGQAINGRPLDKLVLPVTAPADPVQAGALRLGDVLRAPVSLLNGMEVRIPSPAGSSNGRLLVFGSDPEVIEQEPNNRPEEAQRLAFPCAVSGQFNPQKDVDYFVFPAKKGEPFVVSVHAQRIGSPADPDMEVVKPGKEGVVLKQDDGENIGSLRFNTQSRDVRFEHVPLSDGDYLLRVEHLYGQVQGGPQYFYRLEVARNLPDFQLICVPPNETRVDSHVLYRGGHERMDVLVWRIGGHKSPITITARNLPPGVTAQPFVIPPMSKWGTLVLEASADAPIGEAEIEIVGVSEGPTASAGASGPVNTAGSSGQASTAGSSGQTNTVERRARGGVETWDTTNTPAVARMTRSIVLAVRDSAPFVVSATPVESQVKAGQPLSLKLNVQRRPDMPSEVQFTAAGLPPINGLEVPLSKLAAGETQKTIQLQVTAKMLPGQYNFILNGEAQVPFENPPGTKKNIRCLYPTNPIAIEVLPADVKK